MKKTIYMCDVCETTVSFEDFKEGVEICGETKDLCTDCYEEASECYFCGNFQLEFYTCQRCSADACNECVENKFQCLKCFNFICPDCVFLTIGEHGWKIDSICKDCIPRNHKKEINQFVGYCVCDTDKSDTIIIEKTS